MGPGHRVVGVDVGGLRKGFDVAVLDGDRVEVLRTRDVARVVDVADGARAVGVDAPAAWAPDGQASRPDERAFARAGICGIRYTPDEATARARPDGYLDWVWQGLALHGALGDAGIEAVEVFPTAAWTVWLGPRGARTRLAWVRDGLARLRAEGLQDELGDRPTLDAVDAVAAALVARQACLGTVRRFGAIAVPGDAATRGLVGGPHP